MLIFYKDDTKEWHKIIVSFKMQVLLTYCQYFLIFSCELCPLCSLGAITIIITYKKLENDITFKKSSKIEVKLNLIPSPELAANCTYNQSISLAQKRPGKALYLVACCEGHQIQAVKDQGGA